MKIAKVIPLYKTRDKHLFTNYRPVSILPQFSKILEKVFISRLDNFIEKHDLLTDNQYGFRSNRSTSQALIELTEEITNSMDKKKYAVGVFIDLKKAFDTINHEILIYKLEQYGIRGIALKWVSSYLKDRRQFVKMGEVQSSWLDIVCGVPQGSVLGPKLFIIYINDICKISQLLKFILFADDTNILGTGENLQQLLDTITSEFTRIKSWFNTNKLSLNLSKTKFIIFGNRKINNKATVQIKGVNIERVHEIKFLGVIINDKICWKSHIKHISTKISRSISVMAKVRHFLNSKSRRTLLCSLVSPYLNYCIEVWGNTYKCSLEPLFILQKRAIRIIHNASYIEHTNPLFIQLKIIKLYDTIELMTAQFLYKARNNSLPRQLQRMFHEREGGYDLREPLNFKILTCRTPIKKFCITNCGVKLWNRLSVDLKQCPTINQFKTNINK